jgi:acetyl-CoA acetyltransferase
MTARKDFAGRFAIVGLGQTEVGHLPGKTVPMLEAEAARLALEDAGLKPSDIEAAIQAQSDPGGGVRPRSDDSFARMLGMPAKMYMENVGRGGEYHTMAILIATQLLDLGIAKYVMVAGGRDDWSRSRRGKEAGESGQQFLERSGSSARAFGATQAMSFHAMLARRHIHEFSTTSRQFGMIAVAQREWASLNPAAYMHGRPMTIEDHQASPIVADPYHLLDCCLQSDSGMAFVVTTAERARDLRQPPLYILGIGFGEQLADLWWEKQNYTRLAVGTAKEDAFGMAGITLKDVDVAQLYDCFTAEVLFQLEDYGWCEKGLGGLFVEAGHLGPNGDVKVNTGGGLLSSHHLGSLTCLSELITQLRGEAVNRQVKDAKIGFATGHGGEIVAGQMCSIHALTVLGRD